MTKFKTCPKCRGQMVIDRDYYGWYEECLYCGYQRDLQNMMAKEMLTQIKAVKVVGKNV